MLKCEMCIDLAVITDLISVAGDILFGCEREDVVTGVHHESGWNVCG